jgi:hypothetical protein
MQQIDNWTDDKGYLGDQFTIQAVMPNVIHVNSPGAQNIQKVQRKDFEGVYNVWNQYRAGLFQRHRIRDKITRFSKYVISILYWVERNNGGILP